MTTKKQIKIKIKEWSEIRKTFREGNHRVRDVWWNDLMTRECGKILDVDREIKGSYFAEDWQWVHEWCEEVKEFDFTKTYRIKSVEEIKKTKSAKDAEPGFPVDMHIHCNKIIKPEEYYKPKYYSEDKPRISFDGWNWHPEWLEEVKEKTQEEIEIDIIHSLGWNELCEKFTEMNEVYQSYGSLDDYSKTKQEWFFDQYDNPDFIKEYDKWLERKVAMKMGNEYRRRVDSMGWVYEEEIDRYGSIVRSKVVEAPKTKPLDDPKLHQKLQETINKQTVQGGSMNVSQKAINKLNGLKAGEEKFVELSQPVSETRTVKVDIVSLIKDAPQIKELGLGKEALLASLSISGDSLVLVVSEGVVERESNAALQAALVGLVSAPQAPVAPRSF